MIKEWKMNLLVREKRVGSVLAKIVMLPEGVEILPMKTVAELLGCGISNVKKHLGNKDTASDFIQLVKKYRQELAEHGIVSIGRGRPDRLITKEEFEFLVKKINTPEAWDIYAELWNRAEAIELYRSAMVEIGVRVEELAGELREVRTQVKANTANITMLDRRLSSAEEVVSIIERELGIVLTTPTKKIVKQTASFIGKSTQKFVAMLKGLRESKGLYGQSLKGNKAIVEFCKDIHDE